MSNFEKIWERYTSSWQATSEPRAAVFQTCLARQCVYTDPLIQTKDWEELDEYMKQFQVQVPGGRFRTTYFLAHHNRSITKWSMLGGNDNVLGEGVSYGEYNDEGLLVAMTGFFEAPAG